jgi:ATP-dependent phosphofructokinase / diphosphate-dependent phosphofructokinase
VYLLAEGRRNNSDCYTRPMSRASGSSPRKRIGVLTGGGDAPGLNAVIRAVVKSAANCNCETVGVLDGFDGLIERDRWRTLTPRDVSGILRIGGTILGTANRGNPFAKPVSTSDGVRDYSSRCIETFHDLKLDSLIVIGGDGTLSIANEFHKRGIPLVGVPKTIDNDIVETTHTFGFDTAVSFATEAVDRLHATGEAHHRIMIAEVMGRYAGWIALHAGMAGGADVILIPEIPFDLEKVAQRIRKRDEMGARFSIVVAAEGAKPIGGSAYLMRHASADYAEKLGGIGAIVAARLEALTGKEARSVLLGHLQRGGAPTSFDRMLATRFGAHAVELTLREKFGVMVAFHPPDIADVPLDRVVGRTRTVPLDFDVVRAARAMNISLGD